MKYTTINIQGNLISEEILQKIEKAEAEGQLSKDFGLEPGANLRSEIEYAWSRVKLDWKHFSERSQSLPANDPYGTTLSRKWMEQFLHSIGFETFRQRSSLIGDNNQQYTISHTAENLDNLPLHIVGFYEPSNPDKNTLDVKSSGGTSRFSPHATMQEYLNVTEHVYGIVSNGHYLRLLRDSGRLIKLIYLEFDIKRMLDEDKYSEFTLLYRLLHATRFPRTKSETEQSFIDKYYQDSIETGNRIRDGLSMAVKESLVALGKGFLQHESNDGIRQRIQTGQLSTKDYYRQLLRIIYRLLFLMVTEERDLIYDPEDKSEATQRYKKLYWRFYSISRLRKMSENRYLYEERFTDLWDGLVQTFKLFEAAGTGSKMSIQPLDGDLFSVHAIEDLQYCTINNQLLLECIRNLNEFEDRQSKSLVSINYRSLDVEELGSVYEGLLELHPVIENLEAGIPSHINFIFHEGTDRKTTGSYYTRPELVNELIKSALIPVIEERLKEHTGNKEAQVKALLKLKVCDAAAGSGHMLLAAARTIAWYLARVQSGEDNPAPTVYRKCLREVIQHCIYAVDYNPDAVELCKLALWLEGHNSGKPLSFLDHKIRNGNSLVGVTDLSVLERPIPDEAYNPVSGDEKEVCKELKKRNAAYRKTKQIDLFSAQGQQIEKDKAELKKSYTEMEGIEQDSVEAVQEVKKRYDTVRKSVYYEEKACHIWTAAFFNTYIDIEDPANPTSERLAQYFFAPTQYGRLVGNATNLAVQHKFFHWPLEFPDVFEQGGFDVMLGNPPWEIVELSEKEYFSNIKKEIVDADTSSARKKLIDKLQVEQPTVYSDFIERKHNTDCQRKFIQHSNRYPKSSQGRIDLYPLFLENSKYLLAKKGFCSLIVPSSIGMGAYNAELFSSFVLESKLKSFFDFENSKGLFPDVHRSYRICLLTFVGEQLDNKSIELLYFGKNISDLQNDIKKVSLTKDDLELFSPNTFAPPIILTKKDLELAKNVYTKYGVLNNKRADSNEWNATIRRMLSLSDGEDIFKKEHELTTINNNTKADWIKLYSGKAIYHYNHRFSFYKNKKWDNSTIEHYQNEKFSITTEYYALNAEVKKRTNEQSPKYYLVGFRDIARATDERTCISSFIPRVGCDSHCRNIYFENTSNILVAAFVSNINSIPFDYFVRQKVIGTGLGSGTFEQLPILPPSVYNESILLFILPKVIELVYCSWDISAVFREIWKEADETLRLTIQKQWKENKAFTGGHEWNPPAWCEIDQEGCPLSPFKWDENRRAILKAELDAIYAKLYGLTTDELRYILDPQDVYGPDFPGETFRVLKEKESKLYGEYRTRRLILEAWERLQKEIITLPITVDQNMLDLSLHTGIYSIAETASITRFSVQKVTSWFKELTKENYEGIDSKQAKDIEARRISFHGLIELVVIGTLRENGFSLKKILKARADLSQKAAGKMYPFATNNVAKSLKVSGSDIVWEFSDGLKVTLDGSSQINIDFISLFFRDIVFKNDVAQRLMPAKGNNKVIIDPKIGLGKPVIIEKEVPVDIIASFYDNNPQNMAIIKSEYNLTEEEVLAAVAYMN